MSSRFPFRKDTSITVKFSLGIGLLIMLIILAALTGFFSLHYVRMAKQSIQLSTRIQALILEMDWRMEKARHNHSQFFVYYPRIGLKKAYRLYAQSASRETSNAVKISNTLRYILKQPGVSQSFKKSNVDLNLYLSSAKRFANTSVESIELVNRLAASESGLENRLNKVMINLKEIISPSNYLFGTFDKMEHFIYRHRLNRERHVMQSAFNKAFELNNMISSSNLNFEEKNKALELLKQIKTIADEILDTDVTINSKFKDFILQQNSAGQISEKLVQLAKEDVRKSEQKIAKTYKISVFIVISVLIIGLIISCVIAYLLHKNITYRILKLTYSAEKLKNGNLETVVSEGYQDELGQLERTFNFMARQMQNLIHTLEEKVKKRTIKLSKTNAELEAQISNRRIMEEQLRQSQKMEAIGTMAGGIAHEFNNILGIIIGNAELATDDIPDSNPAFDSIKKIKEASLRAKEVVQQLLSFSRKSEQQQKPIDITLVVNESIQLIRSSIPSSIEVHRNIPSEIIPILADKTQIHQIIINLCTNAVYAMAKEDGILGISMDVVQLNEKSDERFSHLNGGPYVRLKVTDNGSGIDKGTLNKIFDPYFTTKAVDQGTGMGLAVVHGIVKNHNGAIVVDSVLGKGTAFTLVFPVTEVNYQPDPEISETGFETSGSESILFIDDEEDIVTTGIAMLKKSGYRVQGHTNPLEALDLFRDSPLDFDVVISDVTMPKMNGVELAKKMREIRTDIPIIICTGHSSLIDEVKAKELGITGYIMKPVSLPKLFKTLRDVLDN
ncbi:MAG: response regulator [Desulfobacterales bacterium]|nr:response regulator [Desulfobacterales bacterium]